MKKIIVFVLAMALVLGNGFMMFEGVVASADVTTSSVSGGPIFLSNTVQTTITSEISLTCNTDANAGVVNLGSINGMTGGTGTGSTYCNVSTNNTAGYTLKLQAGDAGLTDGVNFIDPISDGVFTVASNASGVGYSTSSANPASSTWFGLSALQDTIINTPDETAFGGTTTTVNYRVEVGNAKNQAIGVYDTLVTYTATNN